VNIHKFSRLGELLLQSAKRLLANPLCLAGRCTDWITTLRFSRLLTYNERAGYARCWMYMRWNGSESELRYPHPSFRNLRGNYAGVYYPGKVDATKIQSAISQLSACARQNINDLPRPTAQRSASLSLHLPFQCSLAGLAALKHGGPQSTAGSNPSITGLSQVSISSGDATRGSGGRTSHNHDAALGNHL
jgi:hypothetical protein